MDYKFTLSYLSFLVRMITGVFMTNYKNKQSSKEDCLKFNL